MFSVFAQQKRISCPLHWLPDPQEEVQFIIQIVTDLANHAFSADVSGHYEISGSQEKKVKKRSTPTCSRYSMPRNGNSADV